MDAVCKHAQKLVPEAATLSQEVMTKVAKLADKLKDAPDDLR